MIYNDCYEFKRSTVSCPACGWSGAGSETALGELFDQLWEFHCPSCGEELGICSFPTLEQSRANWDSLSEDERRHIEAIEQFQTSLQESSLKAAEELPGLDSDAIVVDWALEKTEQAIDDWTVLRFGERELWREPAVYEGAARFEKVVSILKEKYGLRLRDVVPSAASEIYLYGDRMSSVADVEAIRKRVRESAAAAGRGGQDDV